MGNFKLVDDVSESDVEYPIAASLSRELSEIYTAILEGEPMINQLKVLRKNHPGIPQIANMLSLAYIHREDFERAYQVNHEAYQEFPDYIFARINIAQEYLNKDVPEKAAVIINPALSITDIFPNRKKIHTGEYTGFQRIRSLYYAIMDMPDEFLDIVKETEELLKDEIALLQFRSHVMEIIDRYDLEDYEIISDYANTINDELSEKYGFEDKFFDGEDDEESDFETTGFIAKEYDEEIQTEDPPSFFFPEQMRMFYDYGFEIPTQDVEQLLLLPANKLTEDLCEVLDDAIRRFEYYRDDESETDTLFPWHAMNLLRTMQAKTALPIMLNFLEQGQELNEFYMGDLNTEELWQVFYPFCWSCKDELISFLMKPNVYAYSRLPVLHAFTKHAHHNKERKAEVSAIFGSLINFFMENREDNNLMDTMYMSIICEEISDAGFAELKLLVKNVYDNKLEKGWYENFSDWEEEFDVKRIIEEPADPFLDWKKLNEKNANRFYK